MEIKKGQIVKYTCLPGIFPRIIGLLTSGFSVIANMIAIIYANFGLIPKDHPYLKSENFGRYGIRHVLAVASSNLVISKQNIDQVIIYFTILAGFIMLLVQFALFGISLFSSSAMAATLFWQIFELQAPLTPDQDLAMITLDRVFGVLNFAGTGSFFESCYALGTCVDVNNDPISYSTVVFPRPFHIALHSLMEIYSMGIAFIALIVIIYYVIAIVGETITSGTPFGRRFNRAWFIPRLIMFFALIMPMNLGGTGVGATSNNGINAAQFITLGVARAGSNMASNAWYAFHDTLTTTMDTYLGDQESLIAEPIFPSSASFSQYMHIVLTCIIAEKVMYNRDVKPYVVRENNPVAPYNNMGGTTLDYIDYYTVQWNFQTAVEFSRYGNVYVRFGYLNEEGGTLATYPTAPPSANAEYWGYVEPTCGELTIPVTSTDPAVIDNVYGIQANHFINIGFYLEDDYLGEVSRCMVSSVMPHDNNSECVDTNFSYALLYGPAPASQWPTRAIVEDTSRFYDYINQYLIGGDYNDPSTGAVTYAAGNTMEWIRANYDFGVPAVIRDKGWVGAALWYNKIAEANGLVTGAIMAFPQPYLYPMVMEEAQNAHKLDDENADWQKRFSPLLKNGQLVEFNRAGDAQIASVLYSVYDLWETTNARSTSFTKSTGNAILDAINMILGTNGLMDIRENFYSIGPDPRNNIKIHPLAMLSSLGKGLVDASLRNLFFGVLGQPIGVILDQVIGMDLGVKTLSTFLTKIAFIGFSLGFMLYYVLPFMPFIYFFFAFAHWIKSIFEAIVAMPLWALAHIKIDGEGLPGPWATNGYFLLMEIMLRPTLIIAGFLSSIILFSALVDVLHDVFDILLIMVGGGNRDTAIALASGNHNISLLRGPLDELVYTLIYVMLVYMIGLSCFKMIDAVPNNIMRWMGVTVATFQENAGDPVQDLSGSMFRGQQRFGAQFEGMIDRMQGRMSSRDKVTDTTIITGGLGGSQ